MKVTHYTPFLQSDDHFTSSGSGMPSMNLSSMGLINTSTGSASPTKMPEQASAKPEPAATSTPMSPGAANLRYITYTAILVFFLTLTHS